MINNCFVTVLYINNLKLTLDQYVAIGSLFAAIISIIIALFQNEKVKRISSRNKEQLLLFIDRIRYIGFEHEYLDQILSQIDNKIDVRYLVSWQQAGCDLYMEIVEYYLSLRTSFTYKDLEKVCHSTLVCYQWQEEFWRTLVSMRPENKNIALPEQLFTTENRTNRLNYRRSLNNNAQTI